MFSKELTNALLFSVDEAMRTGHNTIRSDHFMLALLRQKDSLVCRTLSYLGIDLEEFKRLLDKSLFIKEAVPYNDRDKIQPNMEAQTSLQVAVYESKKESFKQTDIQHLLLALVQNTMCFTWIYLKEHRVSYAEIKKSIKALNANHTEAKHNKILVDKLNSSLGEQLARLRTEISKKTNTIS